MFKFLRKKNIIKQKKSPTEDIPDFTAQQLVQRFHSESALCDPSHRHILIEAAEETHAQIQLRQHTVDVKHQAAERCQQLATLQTSVSDLRASHDDMLGRAERMRTHIIVHNAPIPDLEERTCGYEQKIHSLAEMADMVQQATDELEVNLKKSAQKRARSRSKAHTRDSLEFGGKAQFGGGLPYESSASCMEFGPGRVSLDDETSLVDLVKQTHDYLDEIPRRWANIDTDALHAELAAVKELLGVYEDSTRRREARLALAELNAMG